MIRLPTVWSCVLLLAAPAAAQDFGTEWLEQVVRDRRPATGPLPHRPFHYGLHLGLLTYYDTNVTLSDDAEKEATVLVPFLRVRLEYSEKQIDVLADVMGNWKAYYPGDPFDDHEERVYGRIRYVSPKLTLEAEEIFRHVSDAVDAVFASQADRLISTTVGRAQLALSSQIALEANVVLDWVEFLETGYSDLDHWSGKADLAATMRLNRNLEGLVQGGVLRIDYSSAAAPADAQGWYARAGIRGDLDPRLWLTAVAGVAEARAESGGQSRLTADASVLLRWQATEGLTLHADLQRQFGFGGGGDSFVTVNRFVTGLEYEASAEWTFLARAQLDFLEGATGLQKTWISLGGGFRWRAHPQMYFDAGLTWRTLRNGGSAPPYDADDLILHAGIVATN